MIYASTAQSGNSNPILVLFRDARDSDSDPVRLAGLWLDDKAEWTERGEIGIGTTHAQREHAYKVLDRYYEFPWSNECSGCGIEREPGESFCRNCDDPREVREDRAADEFERED